MIKATINRITRGYMFAEDEIGRSYFISRDSKCISGKWYEFISGSKIILIQVDQKARPKPKVLQWTRDTAFYIAKAKERKEYIESLSEAAFLYPFHNAPHWVWLIAELRWKMRKKIGI